MLTRLKVSGFKNLVDVDVRFGPFTCIAGANGVGKSNLFDALHFLSALASKSLLEAAQSVRGEGARAADVRSLFHHVGDRYVNTISLDAEMIVPSAAIDDLGQPAKAAATFLRYGITIGYRNGGDSTHSGALELLREELIPIKSSDVADNLLFPHNSVWRRDAVRGRKMAPAISTDVLADGTRIIRFHHDSDRMLSLAAASLPRTALSTANTINNSTALIVRREMQSWRTLLLEPSALRRPDEFNDPPTIGIDGSHLASALYHLATSKHNGIDVDEQAIYCRISNRLAQLLGEVRAVSIDRDERREQLSIQVTGRDGTVHTARALSDGTLRFLALAVLYEDTSAQEVICIEEPENGLHPKRIPAMLGLLEDLATDPRQPLGVENPLRQVIINTHSPSIVLQIPDDCLLLAMPIEAIDNGRRFQKVRFECLPNTWRTNDKTTRQVTKGQFLAYLNSIVPLELSDISSGDEPIGRKRVVDRSDLGDFTLHLGEL